MTSFSNVPPLGQGRKKLAETTLACFLSSGENYLKLAIHLGITRAIKLKGVNDYSIVAFRIRIELHSFRIGNKANPNLK